MASFYIEEYVGEAKGVNGPISGVDGLLQAVQKVTSSTSAAQSSAVSQATQYVVLTTDNIGVSHYAVGDNPTATTSDSPITGGVVRKVAIRPGQKVSVIDEA